MSVVGVIMGVFVARAGIEPLEATIEAGDPFLGRLDEARVVADDDDRELVVQPHEQIAKAFGGAGVDTRLRLVEQEKRSVSGEGAGDEHALPLSAAEG